MAIQIVVPRLNTNDDEVLLTDFSVGVGDPVAPGSVLFTVETSKSVSEIEAQRSGYVIAVHAEVGSRIAVGAAVLTLGETADEKPTPAPMASTAGKRRVTAKAILLAARLDVDVDQIPGDGVIREEDVRRAAAVLALSTSAVSLSEPSAARGLINPAALPLIAGEAFATLSGAEKIRRLRDAGAEIGEDVEIGSGTVIEADCIRLGRGVRLGSQVRIKGHRVDLGEMVMISGDFRCAGPSLVLGDATFVAGGVRIDAAGGMTRQAEVITGRHCLITGEVYLNAGRTIRLGDRVALSPRCCIFTHSFWQSILDGYPVRFADVIIHENAWVGAAVQILPGVVIHQGSIVLSNSTVVDNVPAYSMVGGVPAKVVRTQLQRRLTVAQKQRILQQQLAEFAELLRDKECQVSDTSDGLDLISPDGRPARVILLVRLRLNIPAQVPDGTVALLLGAGDDFSPPGPFQAVFDLDRLTFTGTISPLTEELREFLRRRGLLFGPDLWRYDERAGWPIQWRT